MENQFLNCPELTGEYLKYMAIIGNVLREDAKAYEIPVVELLEDFAQIAQVVAIQERETRDIGRMDNEENE